MMYMGIPENSFFAMLTIMVILVLATVIQGILRLFNPKKDYTELTVRITSWWWIIGLLFLFLALGKNAAIGFFCVISFLALKEFLSIVPTRQVDRNVVFWAYLSIPVQYYWVLTGWYGMYIIFIPVYLYLFVPMRMVMTGDTDGFIKSAAIIQWTVMLTVFFISHIAYLLALPSKNIQAGGIGLILFLLFVTQFNDVCQYTWGKLFGVHKIIPKVSPNKTWQGFLGGLLTIIPLAAFIAPLLTPMNWLEGMVAGLIIGIAGFFGDVVISSVKRDLHIKDSGNLIPGHGGILDRLDSLIYSAPLFFHYIYYMHF